MLYGITTAMELASSVAWRYHQATNHSLASLRRNRHTLDWPNQPRPYKRYLAELPAVPLPPRWERLGEGTLDVQTLAMLLHLSAGITKHLRFPGGTMAFRAAACTGALYHVELYVVCGDLPGLAAGVYHFDVDHDRLLRLREGDFRGVVGSGVPATVVASSVWWRNSWKYQARTYRHAFWDSGTVLANLLAVAAAHGLPASVELGFADAEVNGLLDLDPAREAALAFVPLGVSAEAPAAPPLLPLHLDTQPYSFSEVDEPLIREVHQATSAVAPVPSLTLPPLDAPPEEVILRRGSARAFEQTAIPLAALHSILTGPAYLIANDVAGLDAGAYFYDGAELNLLRAGDCRGMAGHLDLGQALAADAAVNVYLLADLGEIIGRLGERGYRWAQMEASLRAGRMYLAAYAAGLAATGLTFFDDEVVDFFSPHAAGKSVMFLLAIGNRARRA